MPRPGAATRAGHALGTGRAPRSHGTLAHAAALPLLALALAAAAPRAATAAAGTCAVYEPNSCLFGEGVVIDAPLCHPTPCAFDVPKDFGACGFPESGSFRYEAPGPAGCADPFASTARAPPPPCGARCCRPDHEGDFSPAGEVPGAPGVPRHAFQPTDAACRYGEVTRGQLLRWLRQRGAHVAVLGDSMMRQAFLRLVMMLRGQTRLLDYHLHSHASYAVCGEADFFRVSASSSNASSTDPNPDYLKFRIPPFFRADSGPGRAAARAALAACSRRPVEFHYLHAPRWKNQVNMLPRYVEALAPGAQPVVLAAVGYWESTAEIPADYLAALEALRGRAARVFVVSVPTVRVVDSARRAAYVSRNAAMRAWTAAQGAPFEFLDFEALASAAHAPPGGADNNWHYMCSTSWRVSCAYCDLVRVDHDDGVDKATGALLPQVPVGNLERVHATEDGACADEMNRNLWQVALNALVKPGRRRGGGGAAGAAGGGGEAGDARRRRRRG